MSPRIRGTFRVKSILFFMPNWRDVYIYIYIYYETYIYIYYEKLIPVYISPLDKFTFHRRKSIPAIIFVLRKNVRVGVVLHGDVKLPYSGKCVCICISIKRAGRFLVPTYGHTSRNTILLVVENEPTISNNVELRKFNFLYFIELHNTITLQVISLYRYL